MRSSLPSPSGSPAFSILSIAAVSALVSLAVLPSCRSSQPSAGAGDYSAALHQSFTIADLPPDAREVDVWVPLPGSDPFQEISELTIEPVAEIRRDPEYGNEVAFLRWRAPFDSPPNVTVSFVVSRREATAHHDDTPPRLMKRYLEPDRLGIVDEKVTAWAQAHTAGKRTTMAKARALYDFVLDYMTYDKSKPGWGRGDTRRACDTPYGNCSDFHSLFVSLARAVKIPARFFYGYSLKPDGSVGAHCWAEFWDRDAGWVPVDISEADKDPSRADYFFGHLSENRVRYTVGRDIILDPPQRSGPLNFLITPYVEVDGREYPPEKLELRSRSTRLGR